MAGRETEQSLKDRSGGLLAVRLDISGVVQGVGFRPHVYRLASEAGLKGWVRNTGSGVEIHVEGLQGELDRFCAAVQTQAPPLARISSLKRAPSRATGHSDFRILVSQNRNPGSTQMSPDVAMCADCQRELFDPGDRRYRYPFINCTNCGPRFTIIAGLPYDRPATSMSTFEMCADCRAEYQDPRDRRFHAQPVACPECGPQVWLEAVGARLSSGEDAIQAARRALAEGQILALKGLGGFHLACDAFNSQAVARLRDRKARQSKALAVMFSDITAVDQHCYLSEPSRRLLLEPSRPIVVLSRRPDSAISDLVAPDQASLGAMLPYTPLHALLLEPGPGVPSALIMTSGNRASLPIVADNQSAREELAGVADLMLMHDREIVARCDDSVIRADSEREIPIRRSRGLAPLPLRLPMESPPILAVGAEQKNAFALTRGQEAFVSQHIGELTSYESLSSVAAAIEHLQDVLRIAPQVIACDLHPDYLSTRYAQERGGENDLVRVQHHHAHIAALMAEHEMPIGDRVIGIAFDGTGYGSDGAVWGGEVLNATYSEFERSLHLNYVPLPGAEAAVREPWRMAIAWLLACEIPLSGDLAPVAAAGQARLTLIKRQIETDLNSPMTSSMGRLFDAAASIVGLCQQADYEAQAAIRLEAVVDPAEPGEYPFAIADGKLDFRPCIAALVEDERRGEAVGRMAARFHRTVARAVLEACRAIRASQAISRVGLSGGVWQNAALLQLTIPLLEADRFDVLLHRALPPNDGGICVGQAAVAAVLGGGRISSSASEQQTQTRAREGI